MRDSQSLLEQILSFADSKITTATVHEMLGTADESRLAEVAEALISRDSAQVLLLLHQAVEAGVDAGQLGEQILGYLRDMMTIGVGASVELLRTANPARADELVASAKRWGTMTLLSAIQILDESLVKMRHSTQSRTILEVAVVQICHLQDLQGLADLIRGLQAGKSPPMVSAASSLVAPSPATPSPPIPAHEKKKPELIAPLPIEPATHSSNEDSVELEQQTKSEDRDSSSDDKKPFAVVAETSVTQAYEESLQVNDASVVPASPERDSVPTTPLGCWEQALLHVDGMVADYASMVVKVECESKQSSRSGTEANHWTAFFPQGADLAMRHCNEPTHRKSIEAALQAIVSHPIHLMMQMSDLPPKVTASAPKPSAPIVNQQTLVRKYSEHPLVKSLLKSIDGDIVRVDIKP